MPLNDTLMEINKILKTKNLFPIARKMLLSMLVMETDEKQQDILKTLKENPNYTTDQVIALIKN